MAFFVRDVAKLPTLVAAIVCLIVASYDLWRRERVRANTAEDRLKAAFRFELDHPSATMPEEDRVYYRVALFNVGIDTIRDIAVHIVAIEPLPPAWSGRLPIPLRVMHVDDAEQSVLPQGAPLLIDVFVWSPRSGALTTMHKLPDRVGVFIPIQNYRVVIQASGAGAPSHSRTFDIDVRNGKPRIVAA